MMLQIAKAANGVSMLVSLLYCKALDAKKKSRFAHCLSLPFFSPSFLVLLVITFIFIISPGAVEHLVNLPPSKTL